MKKRQFTCAITFLVTPAMYQEIKSVSDDLEVGVSDFLRQAVEDKLRQKSLESKPAIEEEGMPPERARKYGFDRRR